MATKLQTPTPAKGVRFQLNANTFLRTGYTFNGWSTNYASSTSEFADKAYVTFDGDRDLYALWKANNYQVKFNANGGTGSMGNQTFTYDQGQYLAANAFGRTGHDFNKWTANADGSGNQYGNGVWVSNLTATSGGIVNLYAQWDIKQYTATFVHNDGTGNTTQKTQNYGTTLTAPTLTRTGYKLTSWNPAVDSTMQAENKTYTAQWSASQYTVTFNPGTGGSVSPTSKQVSYGSTYGTLPTPTTTVQYALFTGWFTQPSGESPTGTLVTDSTTVTRTENHTLYAWWRNGYSITVNPNGGTGGFTTPNYYYKNESLQSNIAITLPTRTGYAISGWTFSGYSGTAPYVTSAEPEKLNIPANTFGNLTMTPTWQGIQYSVALDKQGGTGGTSTVSPTYGSAMPAIVKPTKTGYIFGGYYTEADGTGTQYYTADGASARTWDSTTITTLYAKWTEDYVTITYDSNY